MPWCPTCKNEYVEGMTRCPDCDVDLVEDLDELDSMQEFEDTEEVELPEDFDPEEALAAVAALASAQKTRPEPVKTYKSPEDRYADVKSSAWTFTILGAFGVVASVLTWLDIIKLPVNDFFRVVMSALFAIFFVVGVYSFISAKKLKANISSENNFMNEVIEWYHSTGTNDPALTGLDSSLPEEQQYFQRFEVVRKLLLEAFPEIDTVLLDKLTDDFCEEYFNA